MSRLADRADLQVELLRTPTVAHAARCALRLWCGGCVDDDLLIDAELLVSELATNALLHGAGRITMRAQLDDERLLIELIDEGSGFARDRRRKGLLPDGGWGLNIVEDVASHWGMYEGTTHVWFELRRGRLRLAEPAG